MNTTSEPCRCQRCRELLAYHEAGHAATAIAERVRVNLATVRESVVENETFAGCVRFSAIGTTYGQCATILAGGPVSEYKFMRGKVDVDDLLRRWQRAESCRHDWRRFVAYTSAYATSERDPDITRRARRAVREADELLDRHWSDVTALAKELSWRGSLTGLEIHEALTRRQRAAGNRSHRLRERL